MNEPLVSVICTARNAAATIEMTIQSVLRQTLWNWEMIVVDDGSTDDTAWIVDIHQRRDSRIRLICSPGIGRGRALNRALDCVRAPFIANLDADDLGHPERLAIQAERMAGAPWIALLCTDSLRLGLDEWPAWPDIGPSRRVHDVTNRLVYSNPIVHSSAMIRRDALIAMGGYAEDAASHVDYQLWVRMAARGHRIHKLCLPLAAKRLHDGQAFGGGRNRIAYLRKSAQVQSQAMQVLGAPRYYRPLLWARFLFGLLPRVLRWHLQDKMRGSLALLCQSWPSKMRWRTQGHD